MSLRHCLDLYLDALRDFDALLEEESTLLLDTDFQAPDLAQLSLRKSNILERIDALDQQRAALLQAQGLDNTAQDLRQAALREDAEAPLLAVFELAEHVRQRNAVNGVVVDTYLANNQHLLDVLTAISGRNAFYDASGKAHTSAGSRTSMRA